jgi:hypothetical protein
MHARREGARRQGWLALAICCNASSVGEDLAIRIRSYAEIGPVAFGSLGLQPAYQMGSRRSRPHGISRSAAAFPCGTTNWYIFRYYGNLSIYNILALFRDIVYHV